jgi:YggT family protein
MSILGLIFIATAKILDMALSFYNLVVFASVILSWIRPDPRNPVIHLIRQMTEPVFSFIRKRLPASFFRGGLDVTPIIVFATIIFLQTVVVGALYETGMGLRMRSMMPREAAPASQRLELPEM